MFRVPSRIFLPLWLSVWCVSASTAMAAPATFSLEAARTHRVWGPFDLKDGSYVQVGADRYQLRLLPPDRLSFISLRSGRVYGPVQTVNGRLVEIGGAMYAFSHGAAAGSARPPLPPAPPPPPRPAPIPLPEEQPPAVAAARPLLPAPEDELRASLWVDPLERTPVKWHVDGRSGTGADLERSSVGGGIAWRGWLLQLGLSPSVSSGDILPGGLTVAESSLDSGSGWSLMGGYRQPFLREGSWEVYGGARASIRKDEADLKSSTAVGQVGTNATLDLTYENTKTDITLTELALWIDTGLVYSRPNWGFHLDLSIQPLGNIDVEGGLPLGGDELEVEVEREQPMLFGLGLWFGQDPWRFFGEATAGSDQRVRLGASYGF
ncbi:MAG: hypothetical protein PHR35_20380 [Kiritimatiellae bacterium]|nr:hypothetical protein [Kiritimatiellia bacterium]